MARFVVMSIFCVLMLILCAAGCAQRGESVSSGRSDAPDDDDDSRLFFGDDTSDADDDLECPDGMTSVPGESVTVVYFGERWNGRYEEEFEIEPFCIDVWEASQPDATETSMGSWEPGSEVPAATTREGVLPWSNLSFEEATEACALAGKRLPTLAEWQAAFSGPEGWSWPWGEEWVDQGCYAGMEAGSYPTGGCCIPICRWGDCYEVCDMVGNVSEFVDGYWDEDCYGQEEILVAGGPSHYPHDTMNSQEEDPEHAGCYRFTAYSLQRSGLHHHVRNMGFEDDGVRCALTPSAEDGRLLNSRPAH